MRFNFLKNKRINSEVAPEDIFMDGENLPQFDTQQFEGRIERPISQRMIVALGIFFIFIGISFVWQLSILQIKKGEAFFQKSEVNSLDKIPVFADRGVIYDKNKVELAWNSESPEDITHLFRTYIKDPGFSHLLGYVSYPSKDKSGTYWQQEFIGKDGVEKAYNDRLKGKNGVKVLETDAHGVVQSENIINPGTQGDNIVLSIDSKIQSKLYEYLQSLTLDGGFKSGSAVIMDVAYNDRLKGKNGVKVLETDAHGVVQSENIINPGTQGDNIVLSIDSKIQSKLYEYLQSLALDGGFKGGSAVIMDVTNGELLAITNYPEYSSDILSRGDNIEEINRYINDSVHKPFLNRAIAGLYTPGSIVKPFVAIGALNENIIDPLTNILSTGSISIPNPYFPNQKSVFKDWKAHGYVDMREAIAVSSDVYFYEVGGGFKSQKGLGILNIEKYSKMFGISEKTGVDIAGEVEGTIPTPEWKKRKFKDDPWRVGDTYFTSIGQYGYQVTPIQMVRATGAIANKGTLLTPHVLAEKDVTYPIEKIDIPDEYFTIVGEGMRQAVTAGTAISMNFPEVKIAAKTGTAQVGISKQNVNSWVIGFFPYDHPRYAFTVMMENGPANNAVKASYVAKQLFQWMSLYSPDYFRTE
jgi:penicillin-binding protein 2